RCLCPFYRCSTGSILPQAFRPHDGGRGYLLPEINTGAPAMMPDELRTRRNRRQQDRVGTVTNDSKPWRTSPPTAGPFSSALRWGSQTCPGGIMRDIEQLPLLIGDIYDAALDPSRWNDAL